MTQDSATSADEKSSPSRAIETPDSKGEASAVQRGLGPASFGRVFRELGNRLRHGGSGMLPVLIGLVIIVIIFQVESSRFLSPTNLANLLTQAAPLILLGMAEVFVLLLGEIDLSIGFGGGVGAVVAVALYSSAVGPGWPWWLAVPAGLATVAFLGLIQGLLITLLRLPSFVVTLGGLLGFEGLLIYLVLHIGGHNNGGVIRIPPDSVMKHFVSGTLSPLVGWIAMIVVVLIYAFFQFRRNVRRRATGLVAQPVALTSIKVIGVAILGVALVVVCDINRGSESVELRGVPWAVPIVIGVLVIWTFMFSRTRFGKYYYAIGGSAEAARRAGISLFRIRLSAFILGGTTAGAAMIMYASRLGTVSANIRGGQLVLFAVAAAVIGGTSLFGGRGKMVHALLGGFIVGVIRNGMGLLGFSAAVQFMVTALVLVAAIVIDALARRGKATVGN